jgi:uncharacterized protein
MPEKNRGIDSPGEVGEPDEPNPEHESIAADSEPVDLEQAAPDFPPSQLLEIRQNRIDEVRREFERMAFGTTPLGFSIDGRTFGYEAPVVPFLRVGGHVVLRLKDDSQYLGRITSQDPMLREGPDYGLKIHRGSYQFHAVSGADLVYRAHVRRIHGTGEILGKVEQGTRLTTSTAQDVFESAELTSAPDEVVAQYFKSARQGQKAVLEIGRVLYVNTPVPVLLKADGFNRHTFLCGQSGSGKTFALGVVLEQLLLHTTLRIIVLDPNSDFVHLPDVLPLKQVNETKTPPLTQEEYEKLAASYKEIALELCVARPPSIGGQHDLRLRISDLQEEEQAAVLQLDPINDLEEYNNFLKIIDKLRRNKRQYTWSDIINEVNFDAARKIRLRIENLGIAEWEIWCTNSDAHSLPDELQSQPNRRCVIVDLGTLKSAKEKSVVAMALLGYYWRDRNRTPSAPVLIVVDEAHNVCPAQPETELQEISTDHMIRIAGEGRKFGLHLMLASQRPAKIHPNVLSQCDNLMLMRMNSSADLAQIAETFSQVAASLLARSPSFALGESLLTGKIIPAATFAKFEGRLSREGGLDPSTAWADELRRPNQPNCSPNSST